MHTNRYWIAINGASVAAHLLAPFKRPRVRPTHELLEDRLELNDGETPQAALKSWRAS